MFAVFLHVSLFGAIASKRLATSRACGHLRVWGKQNGDCSIEPRGLPCGPFSAAASVRRGTGLPLRVEGWDQGKRMIEFYSPTGPAFGRHSSNERGSLRLV